MIDNGHSWSSIQQYTLSEIGAFLKVIVRNEVKDKAESLSNSWLAHNINQESLTKILKDILPDLIEDAPVNDPKVIRKNWIALANLKRTR